MKNWISGIARSFRKGRWYVLSVSLILITVIAGAMLWNNGYEARIIVTGSMDGDVQEYPIGSIPAGSVVIIGKEYDLKIGDVIAFDSDINGKGVIIVHRIVSIDDCILTHGDANPETSVEKVDEEQVIGKVICVIPGLGKTLLFLKDYTTIIAIVLLIVTAVTVTSFFGKRKEGDSNE